MGKSTMDVTVTLYTIEGDDPKVVDELAAEIKATPGCKEVLVSQGIGFTFEKDKPTPVMEYANGRQFHGPEKIMEEVRRMREVADEYGTRRGGIHSNDRYATFKRTVSVVTQDAPIPEPLIDEIGEQFVLLIVMLLYRPGLFETHQGRNAGGIALPGTDQRGKRAKNHMYNENTNSQKLHTHPIVPQENPVFEYTYGEYCFGKPTEKDGKLVYPSDHGKIRPASKPFNEFLAKLGFNFDTHKIRYPRNWDNDLFIDGVREFIRRKFGLSFAEMFDAKREEAEQGVLTSPNAPPRAEDVKGFKTVVIYFSSYPMSPGKWACKIGSSVKPDERQVPLSCGLHVRLWPLLTIDYGTPAMEMMIHRELDGHRLKGGKGEVFDDEAARDLIARILLDGYLKDFIDACTPDEKK
jgi:hypothetical protein